MCLNAGADWLKFICKSEGGERSICIARSECMRELAKANRIKSAYMHFVEKAGLRRKCNVKATHQEGYSFIHSFIHSFIQ